MSSKNVRRIVNNELEKLWQEAIVAQFEVLSQNLSKETEQGHKNLQSEQ
jgi:hypothetical protein